MPYEISVRTISRLRPSGIYSCAGLNFTKLLLFFALNLRSKKRNKMKHLFLFVLFAALVFRADAQEFSAIPDSVWSHGDTACRGNEFYGFDTLLTPPLLFAGSKVSLDLDNLMDEYGSQWLTLDVIYDDKEIENFDILFKKGEKHKGPVFDLKKGKGKNIGMIRLYKFGPLMDVRVNKLEVVKNGRAENMDDSKLGSASFRDGDFARFKVLRVKYPVAKPPFFMGVKAKKVTVTAYSLPNKKHPEYKKATLLVNCIDTDKEWRETFTFELSPQPAEYTFEIPEGLETEYEGYFMILMPVPNSADVAIRKITMEE